jgi:P-type Cu+ transporter
MFTSAQGTINPCAHREAVGTAIVLDKTGTLTEGKPALTDVGNVGGTPEQELLHLVASAEKDSEHPLAEAIVIGAPTWGQGG